MIKCNLRLFNNHSNPAIPTFPCFQNSPNFSPKFPKTFLDTPRGLFVRTLQLVCHNLTSTWRNDTQFSIVALEVLTCLARIKIGDIPSQSVMNQSIMNQSIMNQSIMNQSFMSEVKKSCEMICDYIVNQCSRPPPFHSKDMHSTIVAAYQSLSVWLQEYPDLLQESDCINTVLQVIELGISGSKSCSTQSKNGTNETVYKSAKELKPASMRVREAAESLLASLMNHFGSSSTSSPSSTSSLDEVSLLKRTKVHNQDSSFKMYRFFSYGTSTILSILKESENDDTFFIVRSPFGKSSWSLSSQLLPRRMSNLNVSNIVPRPTSVEHFLNRSKSHIKHFPESIEKIPLTKL